MSIQLATDVVPALGCVVTCMLYASPFNAVQLVKQNKSLGLFNPLPLVAMMGNTVGWLVYACIVADAYVLASNIPGVLLAFYMTFICYGYADEKMQYDMLMGVLTLSGILIIAATSISFGYLDHAQMAGIWGSTTVCILLVFYTAPLSVLAEVLRTRSSARLHMPFAFMNMANGLLWSAYGLALPDAFIWGPNAVGAVFGAVQVILCLMFPNKDRSKQAFSPDDPNIELGHLSSDKD